MLSSNGINTIDERAYDSPLLPRLKHVSLMSNALKDWKDVDRLGAWCPTLESLTLAGNPLLEGSLHPADTLTPLHSGGSPSYQGTL